MANTMTQAQVEAALRPLGFTGSATGGAAQAFLNANPAANAAFSAISTGAAQQAASAPAASSSGPSIVDRAQNNQPSIGATRQSNGDGVTKPMYYSETWDGTKWVMNPAGGAKSTTANQPFWNQAIATDLGKLFGLLRPGETATGGLLDSRAAALTDPAKKAEYQRIASGLQQGTLDPSTLVDYFTDFEIERQKSNDPEFGSLAKAPYKPFTPYSGAKPEFEPFSLSKFVESPDYKFRKEEGQKGLDRAASTRGNFYSGGALKEAADFNSNLAAGEYGDAYNRYNNDFGMKYGIYGDDYNRYNTDFGVGYNQAAGDSDRIYNRFAGLAGAGSGTANAAVNNNTNNANATGNIYGQVANSKAGSYIQGGNNISEILANSFGNSSYVKNKGAR